MIELPQTFIYCSESAALFHIWVTTSAWSHLAYLSLFREKCEDLEIVARKIKDTKEKMET